MNRTNTKTASNTTIIPNRAALLGLLAGGALAGLAATASAGNVQLQVTVENLAPTNSVTFAPLRVGFHNGTYDAFNNGQAASDAIISIAEGGSGADWFPAFAAADPTATLGSVVGDPAGPLLPGQSVSSVFNVDSSVNRFFTFASMVAPSNDHFIGNDNPQQYELFDANGNLNLTSISQTGNQIWDAGSEITDPTAAAFLAGGTNALRTPENGVVNFDFGELDAYNGLETAAGYIFDRQFAGGDEIYRISFSIVPAPGGMALLGLGGLAVTRRRR